MLTLQQTAQELLSFEDVLILCHRNPDGDTLGSGYALCRAYLEHGVRARVFCSDEVPEKFHYLSDGIPQTEFTPRHILSVDVADPGLLGEKALNLVASLHPVELSIDHHPTHRQFADEIYVEANSASCCEIIRVLLEEMGWEVTPSIASCLYTGIATDTGCFKFSNTSPRTHRIAAEMIEKGADYIPINKVMFDTLTFPELALERLALEKMWMSEDGSIAVMTITTDMLHKTSVSESELDRITSFTRKIKGVEIGITIKQRGPEDFKVSVRTGESRSAADICAVFGGGGHARAAGCQFNEADPVHIREQLLQAVRDTDPEVCHG
ncbi:MAG: DHH family phosphoesterase [Candidatus Faecivivens sp.]|nr:DHH family phosphoesterase [Candidatus Faecivivens sp.]